MVTDEMLKRAVEAYAKDTGAEGFQLEGWIEPAIRAALDAALSAAETVAFVCAADMELLAKSPDGWDFSMSPKPRPDLGMNMALYAAPPPETSKIDPVLWVSPIDLKAWERAKAGEIWAWSENLEGQCIPLYASPPALSAQVQDVAGWQPIEAAPHDTNVLLAWADSTLPGGWKMEAGMASWGWRRDGVSNMSEHGQATHWMPLPSAPAAPAKQGRRTETCS